MNEQRVPDQLIEAIRDRNDLVALVSEYLSLKRSGQNYTGLCPFHTEKTASFVVSPGKQIFHCFGCGVGGNAFQFLMKIEGLSFPQALQRLAERVGIAFPKAKKGEKEDLARQEDDQIYQLNEEVALYYHQNLLERPEAAHATSYLKGREITTETIKAFSIGYALPQRDDLLKRFSKRFPLSLLEKAGLISRKGESPQESLWVDRFRGRLLFPIRTLQGRVAGFGGRVLDDSLPKYLNSPETPVFRKGKHLFGLDQAKGKGLRFLIVVEGYFDAIRAHQAGIPNVVATLGTALTQDHLRLIRRLAEKAVLIFDPDEAGARAALRAAPLFIEQGVPAEVVSLPPGEDPDLFISKHGKELFLQKLSEGKSLIDFAILKWAHPSSFKGIDDKIHMMGDIFLLISILKSGVEQSHYLKRLSEALKVREEDLRGDFVRWKKRGGISFRDRSASEGNPRFPPDEEMIVCLLLQEQLDPGALNQQLHLEDFTSARLKDIVCHFWDAEGERWRRPRNLETMVEEESLVLYRSLLVREMQIDHLQKTIEDCIIRVRKKRLQRESDQIQGEVKLAEKEGNNPLPTPPLKKILDLKRELSQ